MIRLAIFAGMIYQQLKKEKGGLNNFAYKIKFCWSASAVIHRAMVLKLLLEKDLAEE